MNNSIKVFGNTHKDDPWRQAPIKGSTKFCVVSKNDVIVEHFLRKPELRSEKSLLLSRYE